MLAGEFAVELRNAVQWLCRRQSGCCHWHLLTDDRGREWSVVVGWSDGFVEDDEQFFSDGTWQVCAKIGFQEHNEAMQCDFDLDFTMPYDEDTGDVCDTASPIPRNADLNRMADSLLKDFSDVVGKYAFFDCEEENAA